MGHTIRTWSEVCSAALHSQFNKGARPHLCMDEWNSQHQFSSSERKPRTRYKPIPAERIFTILLIPFMIYSLRSADANLLKKSVQDMIRVQRSTVDQEKCHSQSANSAGWRPKSMGRWSENLEEF